MVIKQTSLFLAEEHRVGGFPALRAATGMVVHTIPFNTNFNLVLGTFANKCSTRKIRYAWLYSSIHCRVN